MEVASVLTYNDENAMACAINIAYYSARKDYRIIREFPSGHGFADVVFLPLDGYFGEILLDGWGAIL